VYVALLTVLITILRHTDRGEPSEPEYYGHFDCPACRAERDAAVIAAYEAEFQQDDLPAPGDER
jgi:hypothetical protein